LSSSAIVGSSGRRRRSAPGIPTLVSPVRSGFWPVMNDAHPDRSAGLGFLLEPLGAFAAIAAAASLVVSAAWLRLVTAHIVRLSALAAPLLALLLLVFAVGLAPFIRFVPLLRRVRRRDDRRYAWLADVYFRAFDQAYVVGRPEDRAPDLQGLPAETIANLGAVCETARQVRLWPVDRSAVVRLGLAVLVPMAPIVLATTSPLEILKRIVAALL
jgi:hypothetical protein